MPRAAIADGDLHFALAARGRRLCADADPAAVGAVLDRIHHQVLKGTPECALVDQPRAADPARRPPARRSFGIDQRAVRGWRRSRASGAASVGRAMTGRLRLPLRPAYSSTCSTMIGEPPAFRLDQIADYCFAWWRSCTTPAERFCAADRIT
jgi:hypothetical protein